MSEEERTPAQLMRIGAVYDFLARLLPTEGRDYAVKFSFPENGRVSVQFKPYTAFGKVWCDHCLEEMRKQRAAK